jgi:hypothetical protein
MRWLPFLLAISPAFAAEPTLKIDDPVLWSKSYSVRNLECHIMAQLQVPDVKAAARRLGESTEGEESYESGHAFLTWSEAKPHLAETKKMLLDFGSLNYYNQDCRDFSDSDYAELQFKKRVLFEERMKFASVLAELPSIAALSQLELSNVSQLIDEFDSARSTIYRVELTTLAALSPDDYSPRQLARFSFQRTRARVAHDRRNENQQPWRRKSTPTCAFLPASVFAVEPGMSFDKWKEELLKNGEEYHADGCDRIRGSWQTDFAVWMTPRALEKVRSRAEKAGELVRWLPDMAPAWMPYRGITDATKRGLLQAELTRSATSLKEAPGIRALAASEVTRLEPTAVSELQGKDRKLVYLLHLQK